MSSHSDARGCIPDNKEYYPHPDGDERNSCWIISTPENGYRKKIEPEREVSFVSANPNLLSITASNLGNTTTVLFDINEGVLGGQTGPTGQTGPIGESITGPTGPISESITGPTGPIGESITGPTGPIGESITGPTGPIGEGVTGPTGEQGESITGPTGPISEGLTGPTGPIGESITGPIGPIGEGVTGPTGPTGAAVGGLGFSARNVGSISSDIVSTDFGFYTFPPGIGSYNDPAFELITGTFTAPVAGRYSVKAVLSYVLNNNIASAPAQNFTPTLVLRLNGVSIRAEPFPTFAAVINIPPVGSINIRLVLIQANVALGLDVAMNPTDTLKLAYEISQPLNSSIDYNLVWSVHRIS